MLKLFSKIFFLSLAVLLINLLVRTTVPYFWEIHSLHGSTLALQQQPDAFDVIFIGSSKTRHGINPLIFDNMVKKETGQVIKSSNFSIGGASAGEIFGIYQQIMATPDLKADYIFLELRDLVFSKKNLHTNRGRYWLNWDSFRYVFNIALYKNEEGVNIRDKIGWFWGYLISYIENLLNVSMNQSFIKYFYQNKEPNLAATGYVIRKGHNKSIRISEKEMQKDIKERRKASNKVFNSKGSFSEYFNEGYHQELMKMIEECASRDIRLVILVPPLISTQRIKEYKAIYHRLPKSNKIRVVVAQKYPELYKYDNCYDYGHLNIKGANRYSKILARKFMAFAEKNPPLDQKAKKRKKRK